MESIKSPNRICGRVNGRCMESKGLTPGTYWYGKKVDSDQITNQMVGAVKLPGYDSFQLGLISLQDFCIPSNIHLSSIPEKCVVVEPTSETSDHPDLLSEAFILQNFKKLGGRLYKVTLAQQPGRFSWEDDQLKIIYPEPLVFD
jgi:hypothetical protein